MDLTTADLKTNVIEGYDPGKFFSNMLKIENNIFVHWLILLVKDDFLLVFRARGRAIGRGRH